MKVDRDYQTTANEYTHVRDEMLKKRTVGVFKKRGEWRVELDPHIEIRQCIAYGGSKFAGLFPQLSSLALFKIFCKRANRDVHMISGARGRASG